jgi:hypothetical protein
MKELLKALVVAKKGFKPIHKDKQGARSKYCSLDAVLGAVEPSLHENGLCIVQATKQGESGFYLETSLYHVSGDCLTSTYPLLDSPDPQKTGSSITYARRYAICSLLSVVADEDDDGEAASGNNVSHARRQSGDRMPGGVYPSASLAKRESAALPNKEAKAAREVVQHGIDNGLSVNDIKAICAANNLPKSSAEFKTMAQVTTLGQLIEYRLAFEPAGPDEGDAVAAKVA